MRKIHIDILRIFAAFCVIFNHTGTSGFELYASYSVGSIGYNIMLFCSILCKVAVPLFLMISGALLLNKDISLEEIWCIRIPRMLAVLIVTSFVYYIFNIKNNLSSFSILTFLQDLCSNNIAVHLWYLYVYIAFLMCHPILRNLVKNLPLSIYRYLILLYIAFSLISVIDDKMGAVNITTLFDPSWLWTNTLIYPVMGYYVEHKLDVTNLKSAYKITIMIIGATALMMAAGLTHLNFSVLGYPTQYYHSFLILLPCCALYIGIKNIVSTAKTSKLVKRAITTVGSCTFGIYLMHLVIPIRGEVLALLYDTLSLPAPIAALCYCVIIFLSCFAVAFILKQLPIAKKLL